MLIGVTMDFKRYTEYLAVSRMSIIQAFVIGLIVGGLVYVSARVLDMYALQPLFCQAADKSYCAATPTVSIVLSSIVFHFLGLVALVRANVLRPLLVVLASFVSLIGFHVWLDGMTWWLAALFASLLMAFAYVYFTWINRMSRFGVALALTILSVVVIRLLVSL